MSTVLDTTDVEWPAAEAITEDRVVDGRPVASTKVLFADGTTEFGLWRVSAGEFTTVHNGYEEFIHVVEGEGELIHDDGTVIALRSGVVILLEDGWHGRWVIRRTLVKSYVTVASR